MQTVTLTNKERSLMRLSELLKLNDEPKHFCQDVNDYDDDL